MITRQNETILRDCAEKCLPDQRDAATTDPRIAQLEMDTAPERRRPVLGLRYK